MIATLALGLAAQSAPVEVPFKKTEHAIVVDATLNGKPLSFMFDTGFSGAFIVDQMISFGKATGTMTLRDFVGEFQAQTVNLKSVKVGAKTIETPDLMAVMQPADYTFSYMSHCDGIMGFQVVKDSVFEINFEKSKFVFYPKSIDITQRKPDGKRTFLAKLLPMGHHSMEMEVATSTGKKMILALDTGNSFFATTHRDVLERIGEWGADKKPQYLRSSFVASGPVDSWTKKMTNLTIYGVPVAESYWDIIDLPSSSAEHDGTVGYGFLKNFNITIDYDRRRVWLENFTGKAGNDPEGSCGIIAAYSPRNRKVMIVRVAPESPAAAAGVKVGEFVLSISGNELLGKMGTDEIGELMDGAVGSKVQVTISNGSEVRRLELERKALVNE